jgi:hypothetical protein
MFIYFLGGRPTCEHEDTVDAAGLLTVHAHSFAQQFQHDMEMLARTGIAEDFY